MAGTRAQVSGTGIGIEKTLEKEQIPSGLVPALSPFVTLARQVVEGRSYLLTRRCTQRQYLLRPDPLTEEAYEYCLGEAVERFSITLHGWIAMSNHEHVIIRDNLGNFPEFLAHFHKMVAKVVNAHRGRRENLWATEQPNVVYLVSPEDAFDKLVYLLSNPISDDLVERAADWPGASSYGLHLSSRARTVKRPHIFFRADGAMPESVTLKPERLEGYEALSEEEWRDKIGKAVQAAEERARKERIRSGRRVLGRKNVLNMSPTDSPTTAEPRRGIRPHIACRDRERRIRELTALRVFRFAYREARLRFERGEHRVEFPLGTYWMLRFRSRFALETAPAVA